MNGRIAWAGGLIVALLAMVASGCAGMGTSATPLPPAKMLQEVWPGSGRGRSGAWAAGDPFKDGLPMPE